MKTCAIGGQAVGTTAALWLRASLANDIAAVSTPENIRLLQQTLLRDDAFLLGVRNEDPGDLARSATVSASSAQLVTPASNVIDGVTRDLRAAFGSWTADQPHHWASQALPAIVTLAWPSPVTIREIHLTFDSGFTRQLCLSPSDHSTSLMVRAPQPETVKHYRLYIDGTLVIEVCNNYLRKRVHLLGAPTKAKMLAIEVLATHGDESARLFEARVYA